MNASRRALLRVTALAIPAAILAGCGVVSTTTANGVTTVTVNTAKAVAYTQAGANLATELLTVPGVSAALGGNLATVETAVNDLSTIPAAINAYAAGAQTFSFNTTSVPAFITSFQADANILLADTQQTTAVPASATSYVSAIEAVLSAFSALVTVATAVGAAAPSGMPLSQAMAMAGVAMPK